MSMFDDSGIPNILAPLKHRLIKQIPPPPPQIMPGMDNPAMRLQTAQAMQQKKGQTATPQSGPGQRGPMAGSLYKTLMLKQAGIGEDERDYHELAHDPSTTPQMLHQLLQMRPKMAQPVPQPQQQLPNNGASIGGATPSDVGKGEIQIKRGSGKDGRAVMSQNAMADWMQAASQHLPKGEKVKQLSGTYTPTLNKAGMDEWNKSNPGVPLPTRSTPVENAGFQVSGIQPPAEQAQQQHPLTVEQQHEAQKQAHEAAMLKHQQDTEARAGRREEESNKHAEFSENRTVLDELEKQQKHMLDLHPELQSGSAQDPNVTKDWQALQQQQQAVRQRLQQAVTPQQPKPEQPPMVRDAASHAAIPPGTTYMSPDGKLRRKQ